MEDSNGMIFEALLAKGKASKRLHQRGMYKKQSPFKLFKVFQQVFSSSDELFFLSLEEEEKHLKEELERLKNYKPKTVHQSLIDALRSYVVVNK